MACCPAGVSGSDSQAVSQAGSTDGIDEAPPAKPAAKPRSETAQASKAAAKPHAQHKVNVVQPVRVTPGHRIKQPLISLMHSIRYNVLHHVGVTPGRDTKQPLAAIERSCMLSICTVCDPVKTGVCVSSTKFCDVTTLESPPQALVAQKPQ